MSDRSTEQPAVLSVQQDSRGLLDVAGMTQRAGLNRYAPGPELAGLIEWFWAVSWSLPEGFVHTQQVLTHPCANLSVSHGQADENGRPGDIEAVLDGVHRELYSRRLGGTGWAAAAKTTCGGLGALIPGPASRLTDRSVPLGPALGVDGDALVRVCQEAGEEKSRLDAVRDCLLCVLDRADPARISTAREVAAVARIAETDRSVQRTDDLAAACGIGVRTLQRLFQEYAGTSPLWVLRRYRLLEAAELVREGQSVSWADVAADLGYSDQAHLVRDFRAAIGTTPAAYAHAQLPLDGPVSGR